jgi:uncharacterized protein YqeY
MIKQQLLTDQTTALKSHQTQELSTLRYILAQIKNKEIDKQSELTDEEVLGVLQKQEKELTESIEAFEKAGRRELAAEYGAQRTILRKYLPAEITDSELMEAILQIKKDHEAEIAQNPKSVIGIAMRTLKGKAAPARIMKALGEV